MAKLLLPGVRPVEEGDDRAVRLLQAALPGRAVPPGRNKLAGGIHHWQRIEGPSGGDWNSSPEQNSTGSGS